MSMSKSPQRQAAADASAEVTLYATALAVTLTSFVLGTGVITGVGLLIAAGLLVYGLMKKRLPPLRIVPTLALSSAMILWLALAASRAVNPLVSLTGAFGQHNGVALWVLGLAWLVAATVWAERITLRVPLRILVSVGGVAGLSTLFEAARTGLRVRDYPAGLFESSASFGQFAALALLAALATALSERSVAWRRTSWVVVATCGGAMVVASSRTGLFAAAVAVTATAVLVRLPVLTKRPLVTATLFTTGVGAVMTVLVAASVGTLGSAPTRMLSTLGTGRSFIWRAAAGDIMDSPWVGRGLQQFSIWTDFMTSQVAAATNDPHNVVLALLLGGGVIGGLLAFASGTALTSALLQVAQGRPFAASLVLMLPFGLLVTALVGWIHPVSMVVTCALAGLALGRGKHTAPEVERTVNERTLRGGATLIAAMATLTGLLVCVSVPSQLAFSPAGPPERLLAQYRQWPDPTYAAEALNLLTPQSAAGDQQARKMIVELLEVSEADALWRVDLAGAQMQASGALDPQNPARFVETVAIADRGRVADPDTPVWDILLAVDAQRLGLDEDADEYATRALGYDLDAGTREQLERILSE